MDRKREMTGEKRIDGKKTGQKKAGEEGLTGEKLAAVIKTYVCPLLLLLLPLRHINQGVDISDTGYNLGCFRWFGEQDGMWVYVTYLANGVGHIFTKLPFGNTMLGMNLYCSLIVSLIALMAWYFLKDRLPWGFVVAGEILAILLCWCPHVILYNYLTYLTLLSGTVLLYQGIVKERKQWFVLAGFILGLGVGVRFSNLTHMALILVLWYDGFLKKKKVALVLKDTLWCILGYVAGIASFLTMIQLQYGLSGYFTMLFGLQTMSSGASGYSTGEMIAGAFIDYFGSMKWGLLFLLYLLGGFVLFCLKKEKLLLIKKIMFIAGFLILLRFVYGRGMFGFDYNVYFSIFWWVSLFNVTALVCTVLALLRKDTGQREKLLAGMVLITMLILPLGSNNRSYPVINNLFLIAPVTLTFLWRFLQRAFPGGHPAAYPVRVFTAGCLLVLAVQSIGFGSVFIFRDGSNTEKRDTKIENNGILKGMYTTKASGTDLEEIISFWEKSDFQGQNTSVILYGDVPGLSYLLDAPSAITSTWANLESYNRTFWDRDFAEVEKGIDKSRPVVIRGNRYVPEDEKGELLNLFLEKYEYQEIFANETVTMYY